MARAAEDNVYEVDDLLMQPGTYFNPQTEVVVIVDDSTSLDQEVFNMEDFEGADWVRISEEVPVDEDRRDQLLETFQAHHHPGVPVAIPDPDPVVEPEPPLGVPEVDVDADGNGQEPPPED